MTSALPLDESYLHWLYSQVADITRKSPSRTYWSLFRLLMNKEFVWFIPNDDNRVADGIALRHEFLEDARISQVDRNWMELGCSVLEMLIALSRRLGAITEVEPRDCFWHFMKVLELDTYSDNRQLPHDDVDEALDVLIYRRFRSNGEGGLFPLKHQPLQDQRDVEIWYQLNTWLNEQHG